MRERLIILANWAHRHPSTIVRRVCLGLAVAGLGLRTTLFWVASPLLVIGYPLLSGLVAFGKAVMEVPGATIGQAKFDWQEWRTDARGIVRIWRARKIEPAILRTASHREG